MLSAKAVLTKKFIGLTDNVKRYSNHIFPTSAQSYRFFERLVYVFQHFLNLFVFIYHIVSAFIRLTSSAESEIELEFPL